MESIKVALADDQKLFVESLRRTIISRSNDIDIVGIAYDGNEILSIVEQHSPELVLMDVRMPQLDGVQATKIILERFPGTKVMMLTTFDYDEYVVDALRHGAVGYLLKNISPEEVITSIRAVKQGAVQMSPEIARKHFNEVYSHMEQHAAREKNNLPEWYTRLSAKEREIVVLASKGFTNKQIGKRVNLADQTVRNYISNIYQKLKIETRAQLIRMVLDAYVSDNDSNNAV